MTNTIREQVRESYANAARAINRRVTETAPGCENALDLYTPSYLDELPQAAAEGSLGCGNPVAVALLNPGETVLDLGSGGGIDVLLSARRVGPTGFAYGLDMTDEMLALARANAEEAGVDNVTFLKGYMEDIPLPEASVDVVISNCVINLSEDKAAVFAEIARVLRPGGRVAVTDVVAEDTLTPDQRAERGSWVGCIAGAPSFTEYRNGLESAGLTDVEIVPTHQMTETANSQPVEGVHSAIIRARRPIAI